MSLKNNKKEILTTNREYKKGNKKHYTYAQLNMALDLIEQGTSFSEVEKITELSKSILAREIRKRKNLKSGKVLNEIQRLKENTELRSIKDKLSPAE